MRSVAYLLTIALSFGAGVLTPKPNSQVAQAEIAQAEIAQAANGPYRDGLYLGRLTAKAGAPAHASIGRWSTSADRSAFVAGYEQGYRQGE
jgi:hypothetical protein